MQANEFGERRGLTSTSALGRIKIGPLTTPWIGERRCCRSTARATASAASTASARPGVDEEPTECEFELRGKDVTRPRPRRRASREDFVGWVYADPTGPEHNTAQLLDRRPRARRSSAQGEHDRQGRDARAPPPTSSARATRPRHRAPALPRRLTRCRAAAGPPGRSRRGASTRRGMDSRTDAADAGPCATSPPPSPRHRGGGRVPDAGLVLEARPGRMRPSRSRRRSPVTVVESVEPTTRA